MEGIEGNDMEGRMNGMETGSRRGIERSGDARRTRTATVWGSMALAVASLWALPAVAEVDAAGLQKQANLIFGVLPAEAPNPDNALTDAKIDLGRMLYYDARLSKNQDVSCNTCHLLDAFGVDGGATSTGHRGQIGGRNAPTSLNAALHVSQFWDGRAADVEAQAKGPPLNPIEMAMPSEESVELVITSIPGYPPLFAAAFPDDDQPVSFDNMARAIGAFERRLITPAPFDAFLAGDLGALDAKQLAGLQRFMGTGCTACHSGPLVGGGMFQKLGVVNAYEDSDKGRAEVTGEEVDLQVFKVPSLRNVAETGPWFHNGKVVTLSEAIRLMAWHQLGVELDAEAIGEIEAFLGSLTGVVDAEYVAKPELPPSGPDTPAPDPS
jgi:cytochrome c peroxidase